MGLYFDKSDAQWSYSGFNRFRARLAKEIGFDLYDMDGFGGSTSWSTIKDPLKPLLNHSDCDGSIGPGPMKKLAPRMIEIISKWQPQGYDHDRKAGLMLARDMLVLAKQGKRLKFC